MATWNAAFLTSPKETDTPSQGDDEIRLTRAAIQERITNEHKTYAAPSLTGGDPTKDWLHQAGSAVGYYLPTASAPVTGSVAGSAHTAGQLWYDTTTLELKVWSGTAWVAVGNLFTKVVNIGNWNMVSTGGVNILHGLTLSKIMDCHVNIIRDDSAYVYPLDYSYGGNNAAYPSGTWYLNINNVVLTRNIDGTFNTSNFDSSPFDRGWITLWYIL